MVAWFPYVCRSKWNTLTSALGGKRSPRSRTSASLHRTCMEWLHGFPMCAEVSETHWRLHLSTEIIVIIFTCISQIQNTRVSFHLVCRISFNGVVYVSLKLNDNFGGPKRSCLCFTGQALFCYHSGNNFFPSAWNRHQRTTHKHFQSQYQFTAWNVLL